MRKFVVVFLLVQASLSASGLCSRLTTTFEYQSREVGLPKELLIAVALVESSGNESAINYNRDGSYDVGLFQLNSKFLDYYVEKFWDTSTPFDPYNGEHSIILGSRYLAWLIETTGSLEKGVIAYNVGIGSVIAEKRVLAQAQYFSKVTKTVTKVLESF